MIPRARFFLMVITIGSWAAGIATASGGRPDSLHVVLSPEAKEELQLLNYGSDRGLGIQTSLIGTYVRSHELLVYPFYEYTTNKDQEYKPEEIGYPGNEDFRGKATEKEALIFLSYGVSDALAFEVESAIWSNATLSKAPDDPSTMPPKLEESGFGDTQAEVRWRWWQETEGRPEFFSYFETVFPFQHDKKILGTQDWEFVQGFGLIKWFSWGTMSGRVSASYTTSPGTLDLGEVGLEWLKRFSPKFRAAVLVEGEQDEWALIPEAQWHWSPRSFLKVNNGFGLTSKAPDQAPEVGVVFSF